jgi:hypothetical protein
VPNPLIKVTETRAKMEALIRNMIIGSPWWAENPRKSILVSACSFSEYRFLLTRRRDDAGVRYRYFLTQKPLASC